MIGLNGSLFFYSSATIERFLTLSVGYLYLVYIVFVVWSIAVFGDRIENAVATEPFGDGWFKAGITYAGYNVATLPAGCSASVTSFGRARRSLKVPSGPLGMLPGVLFYIAMIGYHRELLTWRCPRPSCWVRSRFPGSSWFPVRCLLTLVDTGVGLLHAIIEEWRRSTRERQAHAEGAPPALAVRIMIVSFYAASAIGLVDLIAKGYGYLRTHSSRC